MYKFWWYRSTVHDIVLMKAIFSQWFDVDISLFHLVSFLIFLCHDSEPLSFGVYHLVVTVTNHLLRLLR